MVRVWVEADVTDEQRDLVKNQIIVLDAYKENPRRRKVTETDVLCPLCDARLTIMNCVM